MAEAVETTADRTAIAEANGISRAHVTRLTADPAAWVDECGAIFYADQPHPVLNSGKVATAPRADAAARATADGGHQDGHGDVHGGLPAAADTVELAEAAAATQTPDDVLALSSRPGATRTIYLKFTGETTTGTRWNNTYGTTIVSAPYSINDPADTNFDPQERAEIYAAWRSVAEDYAPFDVNVTTADPGTAALTRTSTSDPTYGVRIVITPRNALTEGNVRGGVAYVGIFNSVGSEVYQPAWAFSDYAGRYGLSIAQVIAHEVGHTFGLSHDGNTSQTYDYGAGQWGPIMGASYGRRVSQWSAGEYPDANNREDDLAIISASAPTLPDDHANTATGATALTAGVPTAGVLTGRNDVDAFTITAAGQTYLYAEGPADVSNADLSLTVLDAAGNPVGNANPTTPASTPEAAMHATWVATLPDTPATYTVLVDGVGSGTPTVAGQYSDYGSVGAYTLTWSSTDPVPALTLTPRTAELVIPVGQILHETDVIAATGGRPPYTYAAPALPAGLVLDLDTGRLLGAPSALNSQPVTFTVTDSRSRTASTSLIITVTGNPPVVPPNDDDDDTTDGPRTNTAPKFRTRWLPLGYRHLSYKGVVKVTAPARVTLKATRAPAGLSIKTTYNRDRTTARLKVRGTPRRAGTYKIKVSATADGRRVKRTYILRIR